MANIFIDLHLHLDGSLSVKTARKLARLSNISLPPNDADLQKLLSVQPDCKNLNEYLEKFELPCSLLQTEDALFWAAHDLCMELYEKGFMYAEIRFAPQKHCERGLTQQRAVQAVLQGIERACSNIDTKYNSTLTNPSINIDDKLYPEKFYGAGLILCCMRGDDNIEENMQTVQLAKKYLGHGVVACDLAGAEALFPTKNFTDVFTLAGDLEVPFTIHAGEASGADSVLAALDMGAARIGHGVRALESDIAIERLAREKIPLEICPTSEVQTCIFSDIFQIPLKELISRGVIVTINADNMAVSQTDAGLELEKIIACQNLKLEESQKLKKTLLLNAVNSSFAPDSTKKQMALQLEHAL